MTMSIGRYKDDPAYDRIVENITDAKEHEAVIHEALQGPIDQITREGVSDAITRLRLLSAALWRTWWHIVPREGEVPDEEVEE